VPLVGSAPLQAPDAVQDVAPVEDHVRVVELPAEMDVGLADRETVGGDDVGGDDVGDNVAYIEYVA